jgi:hypothetical protein
MYMEPEPNALDVRISLPLDTTFTEAGPFLDALTEHHKGVQATRQNPRVLVATGIEINPNDVAFWIGVGLGGGVLAFAKRFFEHLADDAYAQLRRGIVGFAKKVRGRHEAEVIPPAVYVVAQRSIEVGEYAYVSFRWEPRDEEDLRRLSAAALQLTEGSERREVRYAWDAEAGEWFEYAMEDGPWRKKGAKKSLKGKRRERARKYQPRQHRENH